MSADWYRNFSNKHFYNTLGYKNPSLDLSSPPVWSNNILGIKSDTDMNLICVYAEGWHLSKVSNVVFFVTLT